jgi:hypothetical protein
MFSKLSEKRASAAAALAKMRDTVVEQSKNLSTKTEESSDSNVTNDSNVKNTSTATVATAAPATTTTAAATPNTNPFAEPTQQQQPKQNRSLFLFNFFESNRFSIVTTIISKKIRRQTIKRLVVTQRRVIISKLVSFVVKPLIFIIII